jgi:hypothetical protein
MLTLPLSARNLFGNVGCASLVFGSLGVSSGANWHSYPIDPISGPAVMSTSNGGPDSRETTRRRDAATRRLRNAPLQRRPSPTLKLKERPASKGRVHKGRTRN